MFPQVARRQRNHIVISLEEPGFVWLLRTCVAPLNRHSNRGDGWLKVQLSPQPFCRKRRTLAQKLLCISCKSATSTFPSSTITADYGSNHCFSSIFRPIAEVAGINHHDTILTCRASILGEKEPFLSDSCYSSIDNRLSNCMFTAPCSGCTSFPPSPGGIPQHSKVPQCHGATGLPTESRHGLESN